MVDGVRFWARRDEYIIASRLSEGSTGFIFLIGGVDCTGDLVSIYNSIHVLSASIFYPSIYLIQKDIRITLCKYKSC